MIPTPVLESIEELRATLAASRGRGGTIGFVPTMGALHRGHARLIEEARRSCGQVTVSIFVNPTQFDRQDDLERYPRTLDADVALCTRLGVNAVFTPTAAAMYPREQACTVAVGRLADHLCGRYRPGHFQGVATVVMKLLQIVQPDRAYFGEKDAQQLAIIRRMVTDLNVPVEIIGVATIREADGLALSSRNEHLTAAERAQAPALYQALLRAKELIGAGETDSASILGRAAAVIDAASGIRLEYLEVVDPLELQPVAHVGGTVLVAGALWVGSTRLIDNMLVTP
jgi:pantoate--beta-alanine ligase